MDLLKTLTRYHTDFLRTVMGATFVFVVIFLHQEVISWDFFLKLSVLERVGSFLIVAFVIGRVSAAIGEMFSKTILRLVLVLCWTGLGTVKIRSIKGGLTLIRDSLDLRNAKLAKSGINTADVLVYISNNDLLKQHLDFCKNENALWGTLVGMACIFLFLHLGNASYLQFELIFLALTLFMRIWEQTKYNRFWHHVAQNTKHGQPG